MELGPLVFGAYAVDCNKKTKVFELVYFFFLNKNALKTKCVQNINTNVSQ